MLDFPARYVNIYYRQTILLKFQTCHEQNLAAASNHVLINSIYSIRLMLVCMLHIFRYLSYCDHKHRLFQTLIL